MIVHLTYQDFVKPQTAQLSSQVARRLSLFVTNWEVLTTDKWVIQAVIGFQIPFTSQLVQEHWPSTAMYSAEQRGIQEDTRIQANTRGSEYTVREGGCCSDMQPSTSGEFLFHTLPGR